MRQGLSLPFLMLAGVAIVLLVLVNSYLIRPRLSLKLEAPEPLPSIGRMPSPPPGRQVETTMNLIKKMAAEKSETKEAFVPRQVLRNPFFDSALLLEKKERETTMRESYEEDTEEFLPQVQMVMIGEYQKSALLDGVLVAEGDMFKGYCIDRITEEGVCLQGLGKTVMLPLGVYTTAALRTPAEKRETAKKSEIPAPVKQKAVLSELLRRLEPLLEQEGK